MGALCYILFFEDNSQGNEDKKCAAMVQRSSCLNRHSVYLK